VVGRSEDVAGRGFGLGATCAYIVLQGCYTGIKWMSCDLGVICVLQGLRNWPSADNRQGTSVKRQKGRRGGEGGGGGGLTKGEVAADPPTRGGFLRFHLLLFLLPLLLVLLKWCYSYVI
jgi:hypothetical protein